jgi:hypothetical protein
VTEISTKNKIDLIQKSSQSSEGYYAKHVETSSGISVPQLPLQFLSEKSWIKKGGVWVSNDDCEIGIPDKHTPFEYFRSMALCAEYIITRNACVR